MSDDLSDAAGASPDDPEAAGDSPAAGTQAPVPKGRVYTQRLAAQKRRDERAEDEAELARAAREKVPKEVRQWAMFCHLGGLAGYIVPFGGLILPIVLWQQKKDEHTMVDVCGREAVNFNITMAALQVALFVGAFVAIIVLPLMFLLIPAFLAVAVAHVAYALTAGLKASDGITYRYPFSIRFVK